VHLIYSVFHSLLTFSGGRSFHRVTCAQSPASPV
jgi:hypothetical protein